MYNYLIKELKQKAQLVNLIMKLKPSPFNKNKNI